MSAFLLQKKIWGSAIFLLTFLQFLPSLSYEFLNWDDGARVVENSIIQQLTVDSLYTMFTSFCVSNYTPLERLSCALDFKLWGLDPWGFRFTNILLHGFNTVWVFLLTYRLLELSSSHGNDDSKACHQNLSLFPSVLSGLFFGIHPLRVESVVWISERRDVLALFFLLPSVYLYLQSVTTTTNLPHPRRMGLGASWLLFVASLLSKASGVVLPCVLLLLDGFPLKRAGLSRSSIRSLGTCLLEKIPFFVASLVIGWVAIKGQVESGGMASWKSYPLTPRILNALTSFSHYLITWTLPFQLSPLYPAPDRSPHFLSYPIPLNFMLFGLCLGLILTHLRKHPGLFVSWFAWLLMILPFTGILQAGRAMAADRYTYQATIPFGILIAGGLLQLGLPYGRRPLTRWAHALVIGLLCLLSYLHRTYLPHWKDSMAVWERALQFAPHQSLALNNKATLLIQNDLPYHAAVLLREATQRDPGWDTAWFNYGTALALSRRESEAIQAFEKAIQLSPHFDDAHFSLANLLFLHGHYHQALPHYFIAVRNQPHPNRLNSLASTLIKLNKIEAATRYLAKSALQGNPEAYLIWAQVLAAQGLINQAIELGRMGVYHTHDKTLADFVRQLTSSNRSSPAK